METLLLLRFDELETAIRPADDLGNLEDLTVEAGLTTAALVDAALGRGRRFVAADATGYRAQDVHSGSTLLTRNCSIQVVMNWQLADQDAYGAPGTIYARGLGTGAAEYLGAGLELRVVNAALHVGELRWIWQDIAGVLKTQIGAHFQPSDTEYLMLTATRRWVSSSEVVLRYYIGDLLLGEVTSTDGSIGGGTTGTTSIGARYTGAAWGRFLDGTIDELRVVDYELTAEEIAMTWKRITQHQPAGYQLLRELHDPGFPISKDPASRAQRETRLWGHGLGFAAAQADNVRENILPDRAYGETLEQWETITKQAPKPGDSTDRRRARVVARLRRTAGVSIPGVDAALGELLDTDVSNLEILAFDQTIHEEWNAIEEERWWVEPSADFTIAGGMLRAQAAAGAFAFGDATWKRIKTSVGGEGRAARILTEIAPVTMPDGAELGVFLGDDALGNYILLGLKRVGADYKVVHEEFRAFGSMGLVVLENLGAVMPGALWLHLWNTESIALSTRPDLANFLAAWSTTSAIAGYTTSGNISHKARSQWAGVYLRGTVAGAVDAKFDDTIIRMPCGDRSFYLYVYRDPGLAGRPDLVGANHIIRQLKQAHTHAHVITSKSLICDDPDSVCDGGPTGGF